MKTTYCNPLDLSYRYQHFKENGQRCADREGADPTLIRFKGRYYIFVSMSAGFWHSPDLINWEFHANPDLLIYDYAPDVRQIGEYLYFCASRRERRGGGQGVQHDLSKSQASGGPCDRGAACSRGT